MEVGFLAEGAVAFANGGGVELDVFDGVLDGSAVAAAVVGLFFGGHSGERLLKIVGCRDAG